MAHLHHIVVCICYARRSRSASPTGGAETSRDERRVEVVRAFTDRWDPVHVTVFQASHLLPSSLL